MSSRRGGFKTDFGSSSRRRDGRPAQPAQPAQPEQATPRTPYSRIKSFLSAVLCFVSIAVADANAAGVPVGFVDRQIFTGLDRPSTMHMLPDGRVLIVMQNGVIRIVKNDTLLSGNFYTVQNVDDFLETGCLGITSDPGFMSNGFVYFYCTITDGTQSHNRVLRVTASGDTALAGSEYVVLDLPVIPPDPYDGAKIYTHLGGPMRFGPDGKLYIATGTHENSRILPPENSFAQQIDSPFGKLLRVNADGSFPSDNPFFNTPGAYQGIFSLGFRNPFGMDIQAGTGRIYVNDVGERNFEEIIHAKAGENYGWPASDGNSSDPQYTDGVHVYPHGVDSSGNFRCAVTGAAFYNPLTMQFPGEFAGKYLFTDYCASVVYVLDPENPVADTEFATGIYHPVALAVSPGGSLYYLARSSGPNADGEGNGIGMLGKIEYTGTQAPRIAQHPQSQTVFLGEPATFSVVADGATGIQWQRDGADIAGANSASYTIANTTASHHGAVYTVIIRNSFGSTTSNPATLSVSTNHLPAPTITSPTEGSGYTYAETIAYSATATDAEDGPLPASAFTWQANFHHDTHVHPLFPSTRGSMDGTLTIPAFEETTANTWIRFMLDVEDSAGQTRTVTRDLFPRHQLSQLNPSGTPVNATGPIERDTHNGGAAAGDGGTITLDAIPYPKGVGVHAPSEIRYELGGSCTGNLIADVGLDDSVGDAGSVVFQVFLDGVKAFDSGLMQGSDARRPLNIDLSGAEELRLVVTDGGNGNILDRANWAGARISCGDLPDETSGGAGGSGPGALIAPPGGGGGCTTGGDGRFDPTLIGLMIAALGLLIRRHRSRRNRRNPGNLRSKQT